MDKPVNKKPKLKKQEILPKRVGGIYEKIYEYENIKTAIKAVCSSPNATKSKKNEKTNAKQQKEKYLGDIDKYTKIIQALLIDCIQRCSLRGRKLMESAVFIQKCAA